MNEPSQNSRQGESLTTKLKQLEANLREKGVDVASLAVVSVNGTEQVIGEVDRHLVPRDAHLVGFRLTVKNPKRFLRLQRVANGGIVTDFIIGDMDMISGGYLEIIPAFGYRLSDLNEESQTEMLSLYTEYIDRRNANRAAESGLVLPGKDIIRR
jgi:hypothetical protein